MKQHTRKKYPFYRGASAWAAFHPTPMHDLGPEELQRPARVCVCRGASVLPCLLSCCCWRRRPPTVLGTVSEIARIIHRSPRAAHHTEHSPAVLYWGRKKGGLRFRKVLVVIRQAVPRMHLGSSLPLQLSLPDYHLQRISFLLRSTGSLPQADRLPPRPPGGLETTGCHRG